MKNEFYQSPEPTWLMKQFWKACGADAYLLQKSTYSDQIKYFCLGGIVVATGVMASLAGGYAMYTIFEPKNGFATNHDNIHFPTLVVAIVFGIIWGLIIYNIDRFIVTSTGKGDGTEAITGQEFRSAVPRIIMGMIIALTISKPIEIRMFKSEIEAQIAVVQKEYLDELDSTTNASWDSKILPFKNESDSLKKSNENVRIEIAKQRRRLEDEAAGLLPPSPPGRGPAWQDKKENLDKMESEYKIQKNTNIKRIVALSSIIEKYEKRKNEEFKTNEEKKSSKDGLLLRLQLAHQIAGFWISLFITLLFMVIELTPIFFKMMLIKGPYDYMDENVKELARAEAGIEIIYNFYEDGEGMEAHKVVNHNAELKYRERMLIVKAQEELNEQIVTEWKEKRKKQIKDNPEQFYSEE
jgi:hypothetical protein